MYVSITKLRPAFQALLALLHRDSTADLASLHSSDLKSHELKAEVTKQRRRRRSQSKQPSKQGCSKA